MIIDGNHIIADEGKVFRRIGTEEILGNEIYLGYSYYINGVRQDPPHLDVPDDFEEIDAPQDDSEPIPAPVFDHATVERVDNYTFTITPDEGYIIVVIATGETIEYVTASGPDIADRYAVIPIPEDTEEEIEIARVQKLKALERYDSSPAVNSFSLFGEDMWLTPAVRDNYLNSLQSAQRLGQTTAVFLGQEIPISFAITTLDYINVYAMQCVIVTEAHRNAILALDSVASIEAYDFTQGYPEKLTF